RALAGLDVLELGDLPQLSVDVQDEPVLEVAGAGHGAVPRLSLVSSDPGGSEHAEVLGGPGQDVIAVRTDHAAVLDAHPASPRQVDPGLDGHAHVGRHDTDRP